MTLYISGPMTGLPGFNLPAFDSMASVLKSKKYDVVNPADISRELDSRFDFVPYETYLRASLAGLLKCEGIVLLSGWVNSKGATLEHSIAKALNMKILFECQFNSL